MVVIAGVVLPVTVTVAVVVVVVVDHDHDDDVPSIKIVDYYY